MSIEQNNSDGFSLGSMTQPVTGFGPNNSCMDELCLVEGVLYPTRKFFLLFLEYSCQSCVSVSCQTSGYCCLQDSQFVKYKDLTQEADITAQNHGTDKVRSWWEDRLAAYVKNGADLCIQKDALNDK